MKVPAYVTNSAKWNRALKIVQSGNPKAKVTEAAVKEQYILLGGYVQGDESTALGIPEGFVPPKKKGGRGRAAAKEVEAEEEVEEVEEASEESDSDEE